MPNLGVAPLDPASAVGQLRTLVGDTSFQPLDPPTLGQGDYAVYSDLALEAALIIANSSPMRAAGNLLLTLASEYAAVGKSIKTDDLAIDVRSRGTELLAVARGFLAEADRADEAAANEFFDVVPLGGSNCLTRPEATPWPLI